MNKITNPQVFRENIQTKFSGILNITDNSISINLEKGVFNYALKEATRKKIVKKWENPHFVNIYIDRLRSIYMNLKNDHFLKQIQNGDIDSKNVAFMTHQEFNPEKWRVLIEKKMQRDASKYNDNIQASTNMYTCRKCKSTRCTYYEMQTRSADEPATIFVTCLDCGKHWRS
jgi:DNA-directed RNA polymerase subunit M/transcription elongation factor TFIIS|tara:strand:- start:20748 stop:21263 length:516 start_codon:yes stop_codon:yes gene_type:complete